MRRFLWACSSYRPGFSRERLSLAHSCLVKTLPCDGALETTGFFGRRRHLSSQPPKSTSTSETETLDGPDDKSYMRSRWADLQKMQDTDNSFHLYPNSYKVSMTILQFVERYQSLAEKEKRPQETVRIAGRISSIRRSGKSLVFLEMKGDFGKLQMPVHDIELQIMCDRKVFSGDFDFFLGASSGSQEVEGGASNSGRGLRRGDLIGVSGFPGRNQRGELCCFGTSLILLAPCVRLLPKEHFGLRDPDARFRHRHLDLLANPPAQAVFRSRAAVLASAACGAAARPFVTKSQALGNADLFLRVAPELYLKRLVIGGFPRVFEIGKCFRNEGVDATHNPEFTSVEAYLAYADYSDWMELTQQLLATLAAAATGGTAVPCSHLSPPPAGTVEGSPTLIELGGEYRRLDYMQAIASATGSSLPPPVELETVDAVRFLQDLARKHHLLPDPLPAASSAAAAAGGATAGQLLDKLIGALVEPELVQPTFLMHQPLCMSPLAKEHRSMPGLAERFELFVGRREIANAYSELNDPRTQRLRFQAQAAQRASGDAEAQEGDESFCEALEYGMPPTAGWGLGVDRLCMLLLNLHSIREVVLFPALRPSTTTT